MIAPLMLGVAVRPKDQDGSGRAKREGRKVAAAAVAAAVIRVIRGQEVSDES